MSAAASLADKAFKAFAALCAGATVIGVTGLVVNVYYNTGKHRNPFPLTSEVTEEYVKSGPGQDVDELKKNE